MVSNLYFNLKINTLSEELSTIKIELVELEVEKSNTHLVFIKSFSTSNMDLLSKNLNFRRLDIHNKNCLLYTSPSPRDATLSRMPSSA